MAFRFTSQPNIQIVGADALTDPGKYFLVNVVVDYTLPEHEHVLLRYTTQLHDIGPRFKESLKFHKMWREKLDGEIHFLNFLATPLFMPTSGRSYQVDLRTLTDAQIAPVQLERRQSRELRQTGKVWAGKEGLVLLH